MATVWRDRRLVYVMSTNSDPRTAATVQRKDRDGTSHTVPSPKSVVDYNKFMGGVDHADQLCNYYNVRTKSRKFYRYLVWFSFDCCMVNAFILWKQYQPLTNVSVHQQSLKNLLWGMGSSGRTIPASGMLSLHRSKKPAFSCKEASHPSYVTFHCKIIYCQIHL